MPTDQEVKDAQNSADLAEARAREAKAERETVEHQRATDKAKSNPIDKDKD